MRIISSICQQIIDDDIHGPSGELVKIEIFAHGALCIAVSGRCGMSLHNHNSSANRGACKQECRQSYTVVDNADGSKMEIDNEYVMIPNNICTLPILDELFDTGVAVLKFEGCSRSPDYVDMVIRTIGMLLILFL